MRIVEIKRRPALVSIVIPNLFDGKSGRIVQEGDEALWFAKHCFHRIKKYTTIPYELILIDNGSSVGKDVLAKWADTLIVNDKNLGFAKACNQGFNAAKGEWILCSNNDIFVWPGWLEALIKTFEDNPDCGVAMPALMKQTKRGEEALEFEEIDLSNNYFSYAAGAEFGSLWLTTKEILDKVREINHGYVFDENFKMGMGEDRRLWRQIRQLEYQTYRTHKTRVFHQGNITVGKIKDRKKYTHPNREYLKRLTELEKDGKRLTEQEKSMLKATVISDFKSGKILIGEKNLWENN